MRRDRTVDGNRCFLPLSARVQTKIFVFVFSQKFREKFVSLFAKKAYEKSRKLWRKRKFFAKTIPGTETFRESEIFLKRNFAKSDRILAYFRFCEHEKGVFVSTLLSAHVNQLPVQKICPPYG
jgi:hypothetical protein